MEMIKSIVFISCISLLSIFTFSSCSDKDSKNADSKATAKHHLNIPINGIQSMMEANTQKIIEGTDGSVIVTIGEVTRKKVDISIKRGDKILDEQIISENDKLTFDYEGNMYTIQLHNIKKPLIGVGKAEISIQ